MENESIKLNETPADAKPVLAVCAMSTNTIDVSKYGFELTKKLESGIIFYCRKFDDDFSVELMVSENVYTLSSWQRDNNLMLANRYRVSSQEQLDFLILNGRVGTWFNE